MTVFGRKVSDFIDAEGLPAPGAKLIVGLSGGADSTALLAVMRELGYVCVAANCNFGLRGIEAERDSLHACHVAERLGAEFCRRDFDTKAYAFGRSISLEMACRELRYDFFEQLRREVGAEAIAVGHHCEDNIETFFLNLMRGSGLHGLRAMLPRRGNVIRPLLGVSKAEILEYLGERGLAYVEDSTNRANDFKRNRLRNVVLPLIEREFPGASAKIADSIRFLRANDTLYNALLPPMPESLAGASPTLVHEWLAPFGFNADQCVKIPSAQSGAVFTSPTHRLTICPKGKYSLEAEPAKRPAPRLTRRIVPFSENFRPRPGVLYLDADAIPADGDWELRPWRPGDRMRPFGMRGNRAVSDILAEAGVPADKRREAYVLTLDDEILWAVGYRTSAHYPITKYTTEILEIYHEDI